MSNLEAQAPSQNIAEKTGRIPITLSRAATMRRVDALFRAMSTDFLLREQFVTDPAQVMSDYLRGTTLSAERAVVTNQLVYSIMSNRRLLGWLRDYADEHRGGPPSRQQIVADFGRAVVETEANHVVLALIRSSVEKEGVFGVFEEDMIDAIVGGGIFADDDGTGGEEGTGPGTGGTDEGTEVSTGTDEGTEQSTGTSTEKSGFFGSKYVVTLEALAQYATKLRDAGALDTVWSQ